MHFRSSIVLAATLGAFTQAAPNIVKARQGGDVVFGGSQICIGLSRGGSDSCFIVPDGCFVNRPRDNTIPTPVCEDGSKQTLIPVPAAAPTPRPTPEATPGPVVEDSDLLPRQLRCQPRPEDIVFGGNSLCFGLSRGGGNSCFQVPDGCIVAKPIDNTIPTPICADGSKQTLISIPSPAAAAAAPQTPAQSEAVAPA